MCSICEPTFDGYVFWYTSGYPHMPFKYENNPSGPRIERLQSLINGPLDLTIPYV
jgi:hypothetical protein